MCCKGDHYGNQAQCTSKSSIAGKGCGCGCEEQGLLSKEEKVELLEKYKESLKSKLEDIEEKLKELWRLRNNETYQPYRIIRVLSFTSY
jgi:hypothetical protein